MEDYDVELSVGWSAVKISCSRIIVWNPGCVSWFEDSENEILFIWQQYKAGKLGWTDSFMKMAGE